MTCAKQILEDLKPLAEAEYKRFNRKIVPTRQTMLGVRLPALRKIAKKTAGATPDEFIRADKQNIYEMVLLEGLVLACLDKPFAELLPQTESFLQKVDNWAQIDSTVADFKHISSEKDAVLTVVKKWLQSDREFTVRAGLVILLAHYVEKPFLETVFELAQQVTHPGYYVWMANAWLISVCMAKFPEETIAFFKNNRLDCQTHNKAIQKSRESRRVSESDKLIIRGLKKTASPIFPKRL